MDRLLLPSVCEGPLERRYGRTRDEYEEHERAECHCGTRNAACRIENTQHTHQAPNCFMFRTPHSTPCMSRTLYIAVAHLMPMLMLMPLPALRTHRSSGLTSVATVRFDLLKYVLATRSTSSGVTAAIRSRA